MCLKFNLHYLGDKLRKGSGGSGLGLYLANIAIKGQFNGQISIESKINTGTTVYISFPAKQSKNTI